MPDRRFCVDVEVQPELVAAERVVALGAPVRSLGTVLVPGVPVVVEDDLLVELAKIVT